MSDFNQWVDVVDEWRNSTSLIPRLVREDIVKSKMKPEDPISGPKSLFTDPLAVQYAMGYKDRYYSASYDVLKRVPQQLALIGAILQTRTNQVASFAVPYRLSKSLGFAIKHKNPSKMTTKGEREFIQSMEKFIYNCGADNPNPHNPYARDDFETFLKKIVRDSLMYDQTAFEVIPDRRGQPYEFMAVDASTIRFASTDLDLDFATAHRNAVNLQNGYNVNQLAPNKTWPGGSMPFRTLKVRNPELNDIPTYVQLINGQIRNHYTRDELAFGIRNPRTDIYVHGYGYSELEQLITIISAHLYAEEYNRRFFTNGSAPKGIINFKGDNFTPDQLEAFRRQWRANVEGVQNCLVGSTRIYTREHGYTDLATICGDKDEVPVTLWTGTSWETGLVYKVGEPKVVCHTYLDNGVQISTSPDHKFRVIGDSGEPEWRIQDDLQEGDVVLVNGVDTSAGTELMCFGKPVSEDFMEALGWLLGDGSISPKTNDRGYAAGAAIQWFYHHDKEESILDKHLSVIKEYFPAAYKDVYVRSEEEQDRIKKSYGFKDVADRVIKISLYSADAFRWLQAHGFFVDGKKAVPPQLFIMPESHRTAYLRGISSADGNCHKRRNPCITISDDEIREDIKQLFLSLGIRCTLSEGKSKISNVVTRERVKSPHLLRIKDRNLFFEKIGFLQPHKQPTELKKPTQANKADAVPRSTVRKYLLRVREANKASGYKLLTKRERMDLNSVLSGNDGCSRGRLLRYLEAAHIMPPAWMTSYQTAKVVRTENTGVFAPMYDVSVDHEDHMFVGDNVLISNSWRTPIMQAEQGIEWIDLHPTNQEMEYSMWIEYLIKITCFTGDTPITMADGSLKEIKDISPGDSVRTHTGGVQPVRNLQVKHHEGPLYHLRAGEVMRVTGEHPLWVASSEMRDGAVQISEPSWKNAADVREGIDYLCIPKKTYTTKANEPQTLYISDILDEGTYRIKGDLIAPKGNAGKYLSNKIDVTPDVAFVLGLFVSEGNTTDSATYFTFSASETGYVDRVRDFAKKIGVHCRQYAGKKSTANVCLHSSILASVFSKLCGSKAVGKRVPDAILASSDDVQRAFLSGVFAGYGSVPEFRTGSATATLTTVSPVAIEQIRAMLLGQDVYSHKYVVTNSGGFESDRTQHRIDINGKYAARLASWLGGPKGDALRERVSNLTHHKSSVYESPTYFYVPVTEVWTEDYKGPVYNIEVAEEHTYQAHRYAVHNCAVFLIDPAELNFDMHGGVQQTPLFESSQEWKLKASRDRGLKPLLRFIAKMINENIISKIDDHFMFDFMGLDELTEQEKHELRKEQLATYMTLNEIRREEDLHDLPDGDVPLNPTYTMYVQQKKQMELQEQQQAAMAGGDAAPPPEGGEGEAPAEPQEGGEEGSQYADGFTKSIRDVKILEISLNEDDDWMDVYREAEE